MKKGVTMALAATCLAGACQQADTAASNAAATAAAVTEAEAEKVFEATVAAWQSMDAARVKALYAPEVVGFDYGGGPLVTDRATWDKNQDAFADAKIDKIEVKAKKIQILGPDAFVVSSYSTGASSAHSAAPITFRCTDIYQREADDSWLITNENCSSDKPTA